MSHHRRASRSAVSGARGAVASVRARDLGFDHIDCGTDVDPATLVLPVGCPTSFPKPQPGWCTTPAPGPGEGRWEWTVRKFREAPGCLLEPYASAVVNSREKIQAMAEAVPGLRFLIDTGHVADWGEDPLDLLEFANEAGEPPLIVALDGITGANNLATSAGLAVTAASFVLRSRDSSRTSTPCTCTGRPRTFANHT